MPGVFIAGYFTANDLAAISSIVRQGDPTPILSIVRQPAGEAEVTTGFVCGSLCGQGGRYILQKSANGWEIVRRSLWVS